MVQRKVLVVDDIPINRKILVMHLTKIGISSDTANDGQEAANLCRVNNYTIVLMDLDMPVLNGFDATMQIRMYEQGVGRHTPIVALTSFDRPEDKQKCMRAGMDGFLQKGIGSQELLSVINSYSAVDSDSLSSIVMAEQKASEKRGLESDLAQLQDRFDSRATEIISEFIFFARDLLEEFELVIGHRSALELTKIAYSLKGSCSNAGLTTMAAMCAEIADDGFAGRWQQVSRKYRTLVKMLAVVQNHVCPATTTAR